MWSFNLPQGVQAGIGNMLPMLGGASPTPLNNGGGPQLGQVNGWNTFSNVLSGIGGIANAYTGFKQLGLAKKQFNWSKDVFNTNLVNQANLVNSQLADRQERRVRNDPNATPVADYMARYGAASSTQEAKERQQRNQNAWNSSRAMNNVNTGG